MKALTTAGLTKLIQLIKSSFISVDDTVETTTVTLADVATTGDYDDLINKPTIPSTDNLANKDLSNLTTNGNDRLHALKGYLDEGELLTDSEGLSDVTSYAHSTFDVSKFTKVGSPTITDEGIASELHHGNYLQFFSNSIGVNYSTFEISYKINSGTLLPSSIYYLGSTSQMGLIIGFHDSRSVVLASSDGENWDISTGSRGSYTYSNNTDYWFKLKYDGTKYVFQYSLNGMDYTDDKVINVSTKLPMPVLFNISNVYGSNHFTGSIDLKQFSITVDGVEVFNGNKEGLDVIKPDDYTIVGSPTISADGIYTNTSGSVASVYSASSYSMSGAKHIEFLTPYFKMNALSASNFIATVYGDNATGGFVLGIYSNGKIQINYNNTSGTGTNTNVDYSVGKWYQVKYEIIDTTCNLYYRERGNAWSLLKTATVTAPTSNTTVRVADVNQSDGNYKGDLNGCKLFINGNLVYQPCLKIPYIQSKTGSKIVQSVYRDRVNDMYEQFGYAPYYTLSDTDFTLPQGEIYGTIKETAVNEVEKGSLVASGYLNEGYRITKKEDIDTVYKYAHSTFDKSKFTKVGSPIISDDGIMSNITVTNYAKMDTFDTSANSFEVNLKFRLTSSANSSYYLVSENYANGFLTGFSIVLSYSAISGHYMRVYINDGSEGGSFLTISGSKYFEINKDYYIKFVYDGSNYSLDGSTYVYTLYWSTDGVTFYLDGFSTGNTKRSSGANTLYFGVKCSVSGSTSSFSDAFTIGSLDLKYFNVKVNGSPVLSGNQTGMDTVKDSNFTAITSSSNSPFVNPSLPFSDNGLTITADGFATGFSASNYLKTPSINFSDNWIFETTFKTTDITTQLQPLFLYNNYNRIFIAKDNGVITVFANGSTSSTEAHSFVFNLAINTNTNYYIKINHNNSDWTCTLVNLDNNTVATDTKTYSYNFPNGSYYVGSDGDRYLAGSIDINSFKIYVNGEIVYQKQVQRLLTHTMKIE